MLFSYHTAEERLLRIAIPWFPSWQASIDGQLHALLPVDHAFTGVVVPAGEHTLSLEYHSTYFVPSVVVSVLCLLFVIGALLYRARNSGLDDASSSGESDGEVGGEKRG